jgi:hypothetical protein
MSDRYDVLILEAANKIVTKASLVVGMEKDSVEEAQKAFTQFHSQNGGKRERKQQPLCKGRRRS